MPRPLRIEYSHAFYHVMNRGLRRNNIFHTKKYYESFLKTIFEAHQKFGIIIHAYCLMNNHYHLIIETPKANLSRAMRHINGVYTQRYNKLKRIDGPLFRGRFKSILIDENSYLTVLNRYIHRNPLAIKNQKLEEYQWSSYPIYLNLQAKPVWLNCEKTLQMLGMNKTKYRAFIMNYDDIADKIFNQKKLPAVLGDKKFRAKLSKVTINIQNEYEINQVIDRFVKVFKVEKSLILDRQIGRAKNNFLRKLAIFACQKYCQKTLKEIQIFFNLNNTGSVSKALFSVRNAIEKDLYKKEITLLENLWLMERT